MNLRIWICFFFTTLLLGEKLAPGERGVPAELGGEARLEQRGGFLWLTARLPEPGGKVLARSIGRNPVWEKDAVESPAVEDRIVAGEPQGLRGADLHAVGPVHGDRVLAGGEVVGPGYVRDLC